MLTDAVTLAVVSVLAALPALPIGKGATILILGGIFALVVSLMWTLFAPRGAPVNLTARPVPPPMPVGRSRRVVPSALAHPRYETPTLPPEVPVFERAPEDWVVRVSKVTRQMGYGDVQVVTKGPGFCQVRLTDCRSCQEGTPRSVGCDVEQHALRNALERFLPRPLVAEALCDARREGDCVFEVREGGGE